MSKLNFYLSRTIGHRLWRTLLKVTENGVITLVRVTCLFIAVLVTRFAAL